MRGKENQGRRKKMNHLMKILLNQRDNNFWIDYKFEGFSKYYWNFLSYLKLLRYRITGFWFGIFQYLPFTNSYFRIKIKTPLIARYWITIWHTEPGIMINLKLGKFHRIWSKGNTKDDNWWESSEGHDYEFKI